MNLGDRETTALPRISLFVPTIAQAEVSVVEEFASVMVPTLARLVNSNVSAPGVVLTMVFVLEANACAELVGPVSTATSLQTLLIP